MTLDQLTCSALNLAHGLGIPVYIRGGRIYQDGPGLAFLSSNGTRLASADAPSRVKEEAGKAQGTIENPLITSQG